MSELVKKFLQTGHQIKAYTLQGEGKRMGSQELWYFVADEEDLVSVRATIANWLNPQTPEEQLTVPQDPSKTSENEQSRNAA